MAASAQDDAVQCSVGLAVAAAIEAMSVAHSGGCWDRGDAAERGELRFVVNALWIIAQGR